ncbi:MAG: molybdopterin-guanine dinucleotide biosynthesis protein B [Candidatus Competibacteraceae bacterium]|nr:molybdopterin-guanine dinucleotide biosynthesis protein B [Candidatus Competibacteraceae bacterium]
MLLPAKTPVLGFVAPSGTGKTTLLKEVVRLLSEAGLRVGVIKQARDDFDLDRPGKDSYKLRKAGVERLLLASEKQSGLIIEQLEPHEPELTELLTLLDLEALDLVLVEGFRDCDFPKIELIRQSLATARYPVDPAIIAVATDSELTAGLATGLPKLDINQPVLVAEFIRDWMQQ